MKTNTLLIVTIILVLINLLAFIQMFRDKSFAKKGQFRIPEVQLLFYAVKGGAFGIGIGMILFRHKIRDYKFFIGIPILILQQSLLAYFLLFKGSF